ncbi:MAG: protein translocase subunit SecDF [Bacteroidales bacterium]|nr:protein translocase subunit SecDF [Bacteroidales bacterium]
MQNKGAILFLAIALALVTIYQLSFTVASYTVKQHAKEYAEGDLVKEVNYLDSISSLPQEEWSYLGNTYKEVQGKEINLGLDLKGGMNVILEVSVEEITRALSNYNTDETFNQALAMARQKQRESQRNFIELFGESFEELDPNASLAAIFGTMELRDKVNFNSTNEEVLDVLREESNSAIDNAFNILRSRIDRFGVTQPNISRLEATGRILVELPGVKDPQRVRELLQGTAKLEFWETYENSEVIGYLMEANNILASLKEDMKTLESSEKADTAATEENEVSSVEDLISQEAEQDTTAEETLLEMLSDTTEMEEAGSRAEWNTQNPLFAVLSPSVTREGQPLPRSVVGYSHFSDTAEVMNYLNMEQIRSLFPRDVRFYWSADPMRGDESESIYEMHAIKVTTRDGRPPLDGDVITSARVSYGQTGSSAKVDMSMNAEGSRVWARLTGSNIGRCIAVVLDGYVRSAPTVSTEIKGGSSEITGDFTIEEAEDLANILKSGKLPAPARIINDTVVGPSLGKEAINSGLKSFAIAFMVVLLYMLFYYTRRAGLVADIALLVNMFFIAGILASLGAVLTLPGIAGIILTIGMSVDANVLIYERIKEELRAGKGVKLAVADGYKNATSAIIDANLTTLLTGIVLYVFGTGPIKGFATTLVIGIVSSFFTAYFITRIIYDTYLKHNVRLTFANSVTENAFSNLKIDFINKRKLFYVISVLVILGGIASLTIKGLNPGIDFTGGRSYVIRFDQPVSTVEVADYLGEVYGQNPLVVVYGNENQVKITTKYKVDEPDAEEEVETLLYQGLQPLLPEGVDQETFLEDYRQSSQTVGPTIAFDIMIKALYAVGLSLLIIFLYILVRFRTWQFGLGAVAALIHDVLIVLGLFSILYGILPFSLEIDQAFIAAILTVVGYSINDTVVVFDRIREYLGLYRKRERAEVLNLALNSTISRTLNTSLTTFVVLLTIFIFGGEVIRGFIFALLVGIIIGTYSSLFVATPVVFDTIKKAETGKVLKEKKSS